MKIDGLGFAEAVERLADKYGVTLRREEGDDRRERPRGPAARAAGRGPPGRPGVLRRALATPDAVGGPPVPGRARLRPGRRRALRHRLRPARRRGAAPPPAGAGVHRRGVGRRPASSRIGRSAYDRFRGRLLWPIREASGETIGFGARRIFDDDRIEAKYLNTPETADLQEEPGPLRHRPGPPRHGPLVAGGRGRGLHRRDGLPPRRRHAPPSRPAARRSATTTPGCCAASSTTTRSSAARSSSPSTATRPGRRPRSRPSAATRTSSPRPTSRSSPTASTRATCGSSRATPPSASWSRGGSRSTASCSSNVVAQVRPRPRRRPGRRRARGGPAGRVDPRPVQGRPPSPASSPRMVGVDIERGPRRGAPGRRAQAADARADRRPARRRRRDAGRARARAARPARPPLPLERETPQARRPAPDGRRRAPPPTSAPTTSPTRPTAASGSWSRRPADRRRAADAGWAARLRGAATDPGGRGAVRAGRRAAARAARAPTTPTSPTPSTASRS